MTSIMDEDIPSELKSLINMDDITSLSELINVSDFDEGMSLRDQIAAVLIPTTITSKIESSLDSATTCPNCNFKTAFRLTIAVHRIDEAPVGSYTCIRCGSSGVTNTAL